MKILSTTIYFLLLSAAMSAQESIARVEADYTARYQYESETISGDYTEAGTVVYYLPRTADKKVRAEYDIYPARVVDNITGDTVTEPLYRHEVLKAFWPVPPAKGGDMACAVDTAGGTATLTYNLKENMDDASEKALRWTGLNIDIDTAVVVCTLATSDIDKVLPSDIRSLSETIVATYNGRQFRRMFGGSAAECITEIKVTFRESPSPAILTPKEAKAMRKRERAQWKTAH